MNYSQSILDSRIFKIDNTNCVPTETIAEALNLSHTSVMKIIKTDGPKHSVSRRIGKRNSYVFLLAPDNKSALLSESAILDIFSKHIPASTAYALNLTHLDLDELIDEAPEAKDLVVNIANGVV